MRNTTLAAGILAATAILATACGTNDTEPPATPPPAAVDAEPAALTIDRFLQQLVDNGWPDSLLSDPQAPAAGTRLADQACSDIRAGIADGELHPAWPGGDNGARLEQLAAIHSFGGTQPFTGQRADLATYVSYRCSEYTQMVDYWIAFASARPGSPERKKSDSTHPRPAVFEWDVDGEYAVGPGADQIPAGAYLMEPQPGYGSAEQVVCRTPQCGVGGIEEVVRTEEAAIITVEETPGTVIFRNAILTPHTFPDKPAS